MTKARIWVGGTVLLSMLLVIATWFLAIAPQRSEAASLREQLVSQQAAADQVRFKTQQLRAQFASLPERQVQLAQIKQQMPENPALPKLVRDLSTYADAAGVSLLSVAPSAPAPIVASGPAAAAPASASDPMQQITTTVTATGTYAELTLYLQKLQSQMARAMLVDDVQLAKASEGTAGTLQMTLTGKVFILNTVALKQAVAVPSTSASTGTPS